ncbi:MAG: hypothetical protein JKY20_11800 [Alphaproteobacteria bacterium]|nr:hypothetical protein [Alphaproteobacteria bacterium]
MITKQEVLLSLYGVWRLLLRDPKGMDWLDDSEDGFWKSFLCAVLVFPGFVLLLAFSPTPFYEDAGVIRIFIVESSSYVIGWVAWPLLVSYAAKAFDREEKFIRYIVAYNWSAAIQIGVYVIILLLRSSGAVPEGFIGLLSFAALIFLLGYQLLIARVGLDIKGNLPIAMVGADFLLGQIIRAVTFNLLH